VITQPLELLARVRRPPRSNDVLAYVSVGALALLFVLFGSKYVLSPGIPISLPRDPLARQSAAPTDLVVNMQRDNIILFEAGRYSLDGFKQRLGTLVQAQGPVRLLLRADRQVSGQALINFTAVAMEAGCAVQLAADVPAESGALGPN
jgi:biopolymer transport protein ExbD